MNSTRKNMDEEIFCAEILNQVLLSHKEVFFFVFCFFLMAVVRTEKESKISGPSLWNFAPGTLFQLAVKHVTTSGLN